MSCGLCNHDRGSELSRRLNLLRQRGGAKVPPKRTSRSTLGEALGSSQRAALYKLAEQNRTTSERIRFALLACFAKLLRVSIRISTTGEGEAGGVTIEGQRDQLRRMDLKYRTVKGDLFVKNDRIRELEARLAARQSENQIAITPRPRRIRSAATSRSDS